MSSQSIEDMVKEYANQIGIFFDVEYVKIDVENGILNISDKDSQKLLASVDLSRLTEEDFDALIREMQSINRFRAVFDEYRKSETLH